MNRSLERLNEIAPLGYFIGAHIRFAAPLFTRSTMPQAWQDAYAAGGFAMRDPMVFWGIGTAGAIRWSEIKLPDPFGVMRKAAEYGLNYGVMLSVGKITSRTLVGVARGDREFTDDEIAEVAQIAEAIHEFADPPMELTPAMIEALRLLGAGARPDEAAARLGISQDALEARLASAQEKLGAGTRAEALRKAREFKLI